MSILNPTCYWTYNCGAKDYDLFATWGNLTIQRNYLRYVRFSLFIWTNVDGWMTKTQTHTPINAPSSATFTFFGQLGKSWCKGTPGCNETYFGQIYKFHTLVEIMYGENNHNLNIDEFFFNSNSVSTNLKFCKTDPFYSETHSSCTNELPNCTIDEV